MDKRRRCKMPVDFEVAAYSYGVGFQHTLDTRAETFSTQMCSNFAAQNTPRWHFQNKRCGTAGNQLKKMTFFYAASPPLYRGIPRLWPMHADRARGPLSTLHVFANEQQTHIKWNFARIKSSTTALQPAATFTSSKAS